MDPQIKPRIEELIRMLDQLKREMEESRGYIDRNDLSSALRNHNDNRDEVQTVTRKWEELQRLLERR